VFNVIHHEEQQYSAAGGGSNRGRFLNIAGKNAKVYVWENGRSTSLQRQSKAK
jgi:hypothetical protein